MCRTTGPQQEPLTEESFAVQEMRPAGRVGYRVTRVYSEATQPQNKGQSRKHVILREENGAAAGLTYVLQVSIFQCHSFAPETKGHSICPFVLKAECISLPPAPAPVAHFPVRQMGSPSEVSFPHDQLE